MTLSACSACGCVQQDPSPTAQSLAAQYEQDGHYGDELAESGQVIRARDLDLVDGMLSRGASGPLLDVGAGAGYILRAAREHGLAAVGIEISHPSAERIRNSIDVEIHEVPLERAPLADGSFGIVIFSHSLEHLADPVGALKRAARLLRPGGLLHVAVPNWRDAKRLLAGRHMPWIHPHHVTYFSRRTLDNALGRAGFEPLEWQSRAWLGADYQFVIGLIRNWRIEPPLRIWLRMGYRELESLVGDDIQLDCPPWRFQALLRGIRLTLALWPDRLLGWLGRSDELRVTARTASES